MTQKLLLAMGVAVLLLVGCNDSDDGVPGDAPGTTTAGAASGDSAGAGGTGSLVDSLGGLVGRGADAEPGATDDDAALLESIAARFGPAGGEPVALGEGETLSELIQRLGG